MKELQPVNLIFVFRNNILMDFIFLFLIDPGHTAPILSACFSSFVFFFPFLLPHFVGSMSIAAKGNSLSYSLQSSTRIHQQSQENNDRFGAVVLIIPFLGKI